jgi:NSS family neurotransmitter:Na+ symporter
MEKDTQRERFTTRWGFILASAGSAVGLGNLWLFPGRLGEYGGAAFLIPYLIMVYALGTTGLMGEFAFGRWAKRGPIGAYGKVFREGGLPFGRTLGAFPVLTILGGLTFYAITTGLVLRYLWAALDGSLLQVESVASFYDGATGGVASVVWQLLAIGVTGGVIALGIAKGIERTAKVLMPLLLGLLLVLMIRSLTLPGSSAGLRYLFVPDWSHLLRPITWAMAMGQAFFSVSLTGAAMLVYGSYLTGEFDIPHAAVSTVTLDTVIALLAALVIMPATFAYGLDPTSGPPLLFITLASVFADVPGGRIIAPLFFLGVLFAALTSLLALMEVIVEAVMDRFRLNRRTCVMVTAAVAFLGGVPLALNEAAFLGFVDLVTVYLNPLAAAMTAVVFFWIFGAAKARHEINIGAKSTVRSWWEPFARYVFVGVALLIIGLQIAFRVGG